jgi:hypothetical protein
MNPRAAGGGLRLIGDGAERESFNGGRGQPCSVLSISGSGLVKSAPPSFVGGGPRVSCRANRTFAVGLEVLGLSNAAGVSARFLGRRQGGRCTNVLNIASSAEAVSSIC